MKILFTGTNAPHVNSPRVPLKYATGCEALVGSLRRLGHEVDWRIVTPGEGLDAYDKVFVVIAPPNAFTAQYLYGVCWTIGWMPPQSLHLVVDDWQTKQIVSGYGSYSREKSRFWKIYPQGDVRKGRAEAEASPAIRKTLEDTCDRLAGKDWPWKVWAPMFRGGQPGMLNLPVHAKRWVTFDPSSYYLDKHRQLMFDVNAIFDRDPNYRRRKEWLSPSLLNKEDWLERQNFKWPLVKLGNRKLKQERVTEEQVIERYREVYATVSCPHDHAGSLWWRNRYIFAAAMGCIVYSDPRDGRRFGISHAASWAGAIEQLDHEQLVELAEAQQETMSKLIMPTDELLDTVRRGLE